MEEVYKIMKLPQKNPEMLRLQHSLGFSSHAVVYQVAVDRELDLLEQIMPANSVANIVSLF